MRYNKNKRSGATTITRAVAGYTTMPAAILLQICIILTLTVHLYVWYSGAKLK